MKLLNIILIVIASSYASISIASNSIDISTSMMVEICDNRIDDDGDGLIDCLDTECESVEVCWQCETEFYQVHSNTTIVALQPRDGTYTVKAKISGADQVNGAQFNHVDGHVYAPVVIDGQHQLGMISQDGTVTPVGLKLPGSGIFYCGAISKDGVMYLSNSSGIQYVDLTQEELKVVDTGLPHAGVADFSLDLNRGLFYGITSGKKLVVFDPYNLKVSNYSLAGTINNDPGGFGAAWSCNDGSFFAYNNSSGKIYSVDVNSLTATEVLNATGNLSINDGFNCVLAPPPFESNCSNGIDDDGDGLIDCEDPDCYASNVCTVEICNNGIDDDLDGWIDCSDSECFALEVCLEICDNGIDDNGNGLVDGDDPQCGTSGGISGGLESNNRLSDKIALRNFYTKVKEPRAFKEMDEGLIPYTNNKNEKNNEGIAQFIPNDMEDLYIAESSPQDLVNITNAIEIVGADFYANDQRVGSILGLLSEDGVYEHTKYICDRVDGSRLLDISYLHAHDGNFISYELLNKYGQQEYAVSFSAYLDEGNNFHIENHWNLHNYSDKRDYYNFQIWANSYTRVIEILEATLDKMDAKSEIKSIVHTDIPRVFVTYGTYDNGELKLIIKNKNKSKYLKFKSNLRRVENGDLEEYSEDVRLNEKSQQIITLKTGKFYDIGASLRFDGLVEDEIFLADGAWGVDTQNPGANVGVFEVVEDQLEYDQKIYEIERSVKVEASVKDYLNIYRSLDAKLNSRNVDEFNSLVFDAKGSGELEVTIVKASITDWQDQFRTTIMLDQEEKKTTLMKTDFRSELGQELNLEDVTMVVFTLLGDNLTYQSKSLDLSEIRFQNTTVTTINNLPTPVRSAVFPNPVHDLTTLSFDSDTREEVEIKVFDNLGRSVLKEKTRVIQGKNSKVLNLSELNPGVYYYEVTSEIKKLSKGKIIRID